MVCKIQPADWGRECGGEGGGRRPRAGRERTQRKPFSEKFKQFIGSGHLEKLKFHPLKFGHLIAEEILLVDYFHYRAIQNLFTEYSQSSVPLPWKQFSVFCSIICSDNIAGDCNCRWNLKKWAFQYEIITIKITISISWWTLHSRYEIRLEER